MMSDSSPTFNQILSKFLLHFARLEVGGRNLKANFGEKEKRNIRNRVIEEKTILNCFGPGSTPLRSETFWDIFQCRTFQFNDLF